MWRFYSYKEIDVSACAQSLGHRYLFKRLDSLGHTKIVGLNLIGNPAIRDKPSHIESERPARKLVACGQAESRRRRKEFEKKTSRESRQAIIVRQLDLVLVP